MSLSYKKIGIIGLGFVGGAILQSFREKNTPCKVLENVIEECSTIRQNKTVSN
jgi:hypothetical protein